MSATNGPTRSKLALRGSAKLVSEFFGMTLLCFLTVPRIQYKQVGHRTSCRLIDNSVLYQRGIYPPEDFKVVKKYGLNVLVTTDDEVKNYIKRIMGQLSRTSSVHTSTNISIN
jgi:mitotic spindle assembly checkpoint protein MAD2